MFPATLSGGVGIVKVNTRKVLLIALAVWFASIVVVLSPMLVKTCREMQSFKHTFDEYADSLVSQHFDESYRHCGIDFCRAMSYDQFVRFYKSLKEQFGPLKSIKRVGYEVHGRGTPMFWRGVLDADFYYEKKTLRFEFVFHKQSDRWVLFEINQL
jgi:hypothetical protein